MILAGQRSRDKTDMGTMFSRKQLQKLILPLIVEQILAITVGMVEDRKSVV